MKPLIVIEKSSELCELIRELNKTKYIAVDTESNSFHAYFDRICLIQLSTTQEDYIIDPIRISDISPLGKILADPEIEKIVHAASNDVSGFKRDFNFRIENLFDTAIASKLLGCKKLGLASILEEHFGVHLNKKWQRCDWGKRPLNEEQLNYARLDTHYLIALRDCLASKLHERDLWEAAQESFKKACEQEVQEKVFQPEGYLHIGGAYSLNVSGKSVLRALYLYRNLEARRRDKAPFRILSNAVLLKLARHQPTAREELAKVKGLPRSYHKRRAAADLLEIIRKNKDVELRSDQSETSIVQTDEVRHSTKKSLHQDKL